MEQIRVNLTFERETWEKFGEFVPNRQKSRVINKLLKDAVTKKLRENEERELSLAFAQAAEDEDRQAAIKEWTVLDTDGWD